MNNLSASAINTYISCGHQYKMRYIDKNYLSSNSLTFWLGHVSEKAILNYILLPEKREKEYGLIAEAVVWGVNEKLPERTEKFTELIYEFVKSYAQNGSLDDVDDDLFEQVNIEADNLKGFKYTPKVKYRGKYASKNKIGTSTSLFTNAVLELFDTVLACYRSKKFIDFVSEINEVQTQVLLEGKAGGDTTLKGYADMVIERKDGSLLVCDIKYSDFDYDMYNVDRDTQLFLYAVMLRKMYPNKSIDASFLNIKSDKLFYLCNMETLLSKETAQRVNMTIKGINAKVFTPCCGGGAWKSVSAANMCEYAKECAYAKPLEML